LRRKCVSLKTCVDERGDSILSTLLQKLTKALGRCGEEIREREPDGSVKWAVEHHVALILNRAIKAVGARAFATGRARAQVAVALDAQGVRAAAEASKRMPLVRARDGAYSRWPRVKRLL